MLRKFHASSPSSASNFSCSKQDPLSLAANTYAKFWSNDLKCFPRSCSSVVLPSYLQMDTNFCVSSMTNPRLKQQSTNREHPDQIVDNTGQTPTFGNRSYAAICHAKVYFSWQPIDSNQLEIIRQRNVLHKINLFSLTFLTERSQ